MTESTAFRLLELLEYFHEFEGFNIKVQNSTFCHHMFGHYIELLRVIILDYQWNPCKWPTKSNLIILHKT